MTRSTVLFTANRGYALTSSRTELIQRFLDAGWRVVIGTTDDPEARELEKMGADFREIRFHRGGPHPTKDLRAVQGLRRVIDEVRPDLVHNFHVKPLVFSSVAARAALGDRVRIMSTVTGLGGAIASQTFRSVVGRMFAEGTQASDLVVFQNPDDRDLFLEQGWIRPDRAHLIRSSGIDVEHFSPRARPEGAPPTVVMLGRLLGEKGVLDFAEVARRVRARHPEVRFVLAGEADPSHPDAVDPLAITKGGHVDFVGRLDDVRPLLAEATICLFPSVYREGVPRAVLEAAAMGVPTVAFDVPGVREAVEDGESGYLVPAGRVDALEGRVGRLLEDDALRARLGEGAIHMIDRDFRREQILDRYWEAYRSMGVELP